ncbi:hypothetical protein D3H55_09930 [Bacillus salacetis]|uniref:Uncharacterized protein n=1 Tax=Bacillus salacetis TaxID=2315464 RepID=A0A3A1QZB8_9BACI|nr:hypothetical protein [Bacillus salacetis]RIW34291.1 hypothetical protein D3H55_09930 [Bacillus salacetis]
MSFRNAGWFQFKHAGGWSSNSRNAKQKGTLRGHPRGLLNTLDDLLFSEKGQYDDSHVRLYDTSHQDTKLSSFVKIPPYHLILH